MKISPPKNTTGKYLRMARYEFYTKKTYPFLARTGW
jgi:hypothetical protein